MAILRYGQLRSRKSNPACKHSQANACMPKGSATMARLCGFLFPKSKHLPTFSSLE